MSIHFDFILKDEDAENLMDWINNEKSRLKEYLLEAKLNKRRQAEIPALCKSIEYVNSIKRQMKNKRCTIR